MSPYEIIKIAKRRGLNAIAITDHNTIKIEKFAKKVSKEDFLVIVGEEIDTKDGHLLAIGIEEEIKPGLSLEETLDIIYSQGGIGIAPHPFDIAKKGLGYKAKLCDAIEIKNALNIDRIADKVAQRFAKKNKLCGVGGSDAHFREGIGKCYNLIDCELELDSILKAVKRGECKAVGEYVSLPNIVKWYRSRVLSCYDEVYEYIEKNYGMLKRGLVKGLIKIGKSEKSTYLYLPLGYFGLGCGFIYSIAKGIYASIKMQNFSFFR